MIAILPAAGLGTRMRAVAGDLPKELLKVGGRSVLQWAIAEALEAGVGRCVVVTSPHKPEIAESCASIGPDVSIRFQDEPRGLVDAVAAGWTPGEDALVLLPDTLFHPRSPSDRLIQQIRKGADSAVAVQEVRADQVRSYGIFEVDTTTGLATRALEKPDPSVTPSRIAVAARYALSSRMLGLLVERLESHPAETDLMSLFACAIAKGLTVATVGLGSDERRLDCGSPEGYAAAIAEFGS